MEELGDPTDSENEGEGEGEEEAEAEEEAEDEGEGEDEDSDSGDTPIQLQINLTTEVEKEVDRFLESEEEQFTFEEFYCMLGPWRVGTRPAEGGAGRAQAARQRVQCDAGEANHGRRRRERGHGRARVPTQSCRASRSSARTTRNSTGGLISVWRPASGFSPAVSHYQPRVLCQCVLSDGSDSFPKVYLC